MDHQPEFDEFEKLLLEIPKVTSGNDYRPSFPICLSSSPAPFQEGNLHLAEGNLNFGISNQTQENPNPMLMIPSHHSPNTSPCVYDPQLFRKLQHVGYSLSHQSQHHMPFSHSHHPALDQSHTWRTVEEEEYMPVNPHYLYLCNNNKYPLMDTPSPRQEHFQYVRPQHSNRNLFCNREDGDESSVRSLDAVRKKIYYPEKILMRSPLGVNTAKVIKYEDGSQNRRLRLQTNQLNEDLSMSLNNLTLQPPKYSSLASARGKKIYYMAKDQHGCRFLQRKFTEGDVNDIEMIFNEIVDYISELMVDPFGNYLVQKLLDVCNDDQRMQIVRSVTRKPGLLIRISCDMHGTRVVQKMVETVKRQEEVSGIVSALRHGIVTLMKNVNGNHVVQRCLQYLLPHCKKCLFEAAITHCVDLATDRHGCCVLQKCIGYFQGEQQDRLVFEIASNALLLSQDPFGNYALQYVFELHLEWGINEILEQLQGNYTELSMQKCSSNVVEKCLKLADDTHQARIISELITYGRFDQVMVDPYGNYVIQAALKHSKGTLHGLLVDAIKVYISSLRTNTYGKKVLSALNYKK